MENFLHYIFVYFDFFPAKFIYSLFFCKSSKNENGRNYLGKNGCVSSSRNAEFKHNYKNKVKNNVNKRGSDKEIKRTFRISHRAKNCRTHIIDHKRSDSGKINGKIGFGFHKNVIRRFHKAEGVRNHKNAYCSCDNAERKNHSDGSMNRVFKFFMILSTEASCDNYRSAA